VMLHGRVADSWIDKAFIGSRDEIRDWNWAYDNKVGKLDWTDEDYDKVQGGFASGFWAEKVDHAWVRSADTPFCASIVKPVEAFLQFEDEYDDVITVIAGWFSTDAGKQKALFRRVIVPCLHDLSGLFRY